MGDGGPEPDTCRADNKEEFVRIRKKDLERLMTEVMQLKEFLPRILNTSFLKSFQKLETLDASLKKKEQELVQVRMDCEHFKARLETAQEESMRENKEKLALQQQLSEAKLQLLQQAEYCTEMGSAACTLLWGITSNEGAAQAIIGGSKAAKFFNISGQTMESYVKSLEGDVKQQQELESDENQFVFALAGIVTNVAAVACGREFLVNSSCVLLDTMMQLLGDLKPGQCTKLKVVRRMIHLLPLSLLNIVLGAETPGGCGLLLLVVTRLLAGLKKAQMRLSFPASEREGRFSMPPSFLCSISERTRDERQR
uniref:Heat shock transcription factor 2 binding protein n=1 Tax=Ornithorhynchus anatinus TaxID=9258 RepID=A0A6I8N1Z1_ORNAN